MNARRFAKRRMYRITEKGLRAFEQVNALVEQAAAPAKVETFEHLESDEMEGFQVFCRFTANGLVYNRGSFLSVDEGLKLNSALQDSYLRRCRLPPDWKPTRRAVVAPVPA